jgi:anti-sigma regulatory factor (Ser/Thr protein kinase)
MALLAIESLALGSSFQMTLDTRPAVLAGLRSVIGRWLINAGGRADEVFGVALAASEAAANAIEHAYGAHEATFTVQCETDGAQARVVVRDSGRWRETQPHGRGRGLELMRSLVDEVDVQRDDDGTTVTLVRRLAGGSA